MLKDDSKRQKKMLKDYFRERGLTLFSTGKYPNRKQAENAAIAEYERMEQRKKELEELNKPKIESVETKPGDDWS